MCNMISKNISLHWEDILLFIVLQAGTDRKTKFTVNQDVSIGWLHCDHSDVSKVNPIQEDKQCRP